VYIPLEKGAVGNKFNTSQLHNLRSELKKVVSTQQLKELTIEIDSVVEAPGYTNEAQGFSLFYDGISIYSYSLPFTPEKSLGISQSFNTAPINEYYSKNQPYYVLAISKKGSNLYRGDMNNLKIVKLKGLGENLSKTLKIDEINVSIQGHPTGKGGSSNSFGFHGNGGYKDSKKQLYENYLRFVDKKILQFIKDSKTPLILVAVEYGQSLYKNISRYPSILANSIVTNPDNLSPLELHKRTFPLLQLS